MSWRILWRVLKWTTSEREAYRNLWVEECVYGEGTVQLCDIRLMATTSMNIHRLDGSTRLDKITKLH